MRLWRRGSLRRDLSTAGKKRRFALGRKPLVNPVLKLAWQLNQRLENLVRLQDALEAASGRVILSPAEQNRMEEEFRRKNRLLERRGRVPLHVREDVVEDQLRRTNYHLRSMRDELLRAAEALHRGKADREGVEGVLLTLAVEARDGLEEQRAALRLIESERGLMSPRRREFHAGNFPLPSKGELEKIERAFTDWEWVREAERQRKAAVQAAKGEKSRVKEEERDRMEEEDRRGAEELRRLLEAGKARRQAAEAAKKEQSGKGGGQA
ncbi:hypothetical protein HYS54_00075 [Candidatus Micrarchaeota archaeon]|nr:hypothetical protein [Candidatus Micrarchaeota archaeon]